MDDTKIKNKIDLLEYIKYDEIKEEALSFINKIGGEKWNNLSECDPGITILENLLFAIMDIDYRSKFLMLDLLADDPSSPSENIQFFNADEILTSTPITLKDYYKIILDVDNVLNCEIIPRKQANEIKGLYDVYLCIEPEYKKTVETTLENVKETLYKNRNLCEDINSIQQFETINVKIKANINIKNNKISKEEYKDVIGIFLTTAQLLFTPKINFQKLSEIIDKKNIEDIYYGPKLNHGFITDEEIERNKIKHEFEISDIIKALSDIDKMNIINSIKIINIETGEEYKTTIKTNYNQVVKIIFSACDITLTRDSIEIPVKKNEETSYTKRVYLSMIQKQFRNDEVLALYKGNYRDLKKYYSIQKDFPQIYGIGEEGPNSDDDKTQVNNLKCYLLIFDQILNIFTTKLNNFKNITAIHSNINKKNQYSFPEDVPGLKEIIKKNINNKAKYFSKDYFKIQKEYLQIHSPGHSVDTTFYLNYILNQLDRDINEKITDHLLARFGEKIKTNSDMTLDKSRFLLNYVDLSCNRTKGAVLYDNNMSWEGDNISSLEKKLKLYFNFKNINRRSLYLVINNNIGVWCAEDNDNRFSYNRNFYKEAKEYNKNSFFYSANTTEILKFILNYGDEQKNYKVVKKTNKINYQDSVTYEIRLYVATEEEIYITIESVYGPIFNINSAHKIIAQSVENVRTFNIESEGVHLIEHTLLRTSNLLKEGEEDPSFKCSLLFPDWPKKFQDTTSKQEIKEWVRENAPAHICINIHWLSLQEMETFECAYKNWFEKKNKPSSTKEEIDSLSTTVQNIIRALKS